MELFTIFGSTMQSPFLRIISTLYILLFITSCFDKPLTITKEESVRDLEKLRMDGYYLSTSEGEISSYHILVLYNNGVLQASNGLYEEGEEIEHNVLGRLNAIPSEKGHWGVFNIRNDGFIEVQYWVGTNKNKYAVSKLNGKILSDTSFFLKHQEYYNSIDTFHFRKFTPKPDSTNQFIE